MRWTPPLWFRVMEVCYFLFFPTVMTVVAVYSAIMESDCGKTLLLALWSLLMFLMMPCLMGDERRETLKFYRVPGPVVRLYCDTSFPAFLVIAFWVFVFTFPRGPSR